MSATETFTLAEELMPPRGRSLSEGSMHTDRCWARSAFCRSPNNPIVKYSVQEIILKKRKLGLREVKWYLQGHTAGQQAGRDRTQPPGLRLSEPVLSAATQNGPHPRKIRIRERGLYDSQHL